MSSTYVRWEVIRWLAVANGSCVGSMAFLGIIAEIGLKGKTREGEQRCNDRWLVKGMVRMEVFHSTAMPDDIVSQLQVIMVPRRFIASIENI